MCGHVTGRSADAVLGRKPPTWSSQGALAELPLIIYQGFETVTPVTPCIFFAYLTIKSAAGRPWSDAPTDAEKPLHTLQNTFQLTHPHLESPAACTHQTHTAGFLFRPLGSVIFGWLGDTMGRRSSLVLSILVMAFPTGIIGELPVSQSITLPTMHVQGNGISGLPFCCLYLSSGQRWLEMHRLPAVSEALPGTFLCGNPVQSVTPLLNPSV